MRLLRRFYRMPWNWKRRGYISSNGDFVVAVVAAAIVAIAIAIKGCL
jgi:hypothetical protein